MSVDTKEKLEGERHKLLEKLKDPEYVAGIHESIRSRKETLEFLLTSDFPLPDRTDVIQMLEEGIIYDEALLRGDAKQVKLMRYQDMVRTGIRMAEITGEPRPTIGYYKDKIAQLQAIE